ncbi:MAG TPA: lysozyme inhibitor LprI family protein [Caulobacteraceae bacterium]|nr:lysozyme inhibitor LprI family protein [Caulobacteraceae bacterium]
MPPSDFPEQLRPIEPRQVGPSSPLPPRRRSLGDKRVIAGVVAASALGIVGGFFMKPNLGDQQPTRQAAVRKVEIPREPEGLGIIVTPAPEPVEPILPPAPKTAPDEGYTPQPVPQPKITAPPPIRTSQAPAQPRVVMKPFTEVAREPARTAPARTRPSFNCRYARTTSERMICVDPNLAAADRHLNRAYEAAIASGVPERVLRRQQDEWLNAREAAARHGPRAVAQVYDARIGELERMRR